MRADAIRCGCDGRLLLGGEQEGRSSLSRGNVAGASASLFRSGLFFELRLTNRDREHGSASSSSGRCDQGKGGFFAHGVFGLSVREHFITRGWFIAPRSDFSHAHHFPPQ